MGDAVRRLMMVTVLIRVEVRLWCEVVIMTLTVVMVVIVSRS